MFHPYKLSVELHGHTADVRAVTVLRGGHIATGSRDHSVKIWNPSNLTQTRTLKVHQNFVGALTPLTPLEDIPTRLFASGGNDNMIAVWDAAADTTNTNDNNNNSKDNSDKDDVIPAITLIGHESVVCALSSTPNGDVVSGSWDKTARLWRYGVCVQVLSGHEHTVWAVLGLPNGDVVTGSADSTIKIWHGPPGEMKCIKTLKHHRDCVRGLALLPDIGFVSCSNDETLVVWSFGGDVLQVLYGHTAFVYAVDVLHTAAGESLILSGSEDRTLKIWKNGECMQTITHPSSVWSVAASPDNEDIVTGCADSIGRVWSRDPARIAEADILESYEKSVAATSVPQSTVGDLQLDKLPGQEGLTKKGTKDGEHLIVKTAAGGAELHSWSAAENRWIKVGDVVDANNNQSKQVLYGKEYDYVFDIDVNEGEVKKIGFNVGENPYMVAQEFLWREELDQAFLDQVAQFIIKNTGSAAMTLGARAPPSDPFTGGHRYVPGTSGEANSARTSGDPFTGANRYVPGSSGDSRKSESNRYTPYTPPSNANANTTTDNLSPTNTYFPQLTMVVYEGGNLAGLQQKIMEFNGNITNDALKLNEGDQKELNGLIATLKDQARYHSSKVSEEQIRLVVKKLLLWDSSLLLPVLDLVRLLFLHLHAAEFLDKSTPSIFEALYNFGRDTNATNSMLALRAIANMFKVSGARKLIDTYQGPLLDLLASTSLSDNRNIAHASVTILLNLSVYYRSQPNQQGVIRALAILHKVLTKPAGVPNDVTLRAVVATGTLSLLPGALDLARAAGLQSALKPHCTSTDKDLNAASNALARVLL